jgi:hypothetical protein
VSHNGYTTTLQSFEVQIISILKCHGGYGETPISHVLKKGIEIKVLFNSCYIGLAATVIRCHWEASGKGDFR